MVDRQLVTLLTARFVSIDDNPTTSSAELGLDHPTLKLLAGDKVVRLGEPMVNATALRPPAAPMERSVWHDRLPVLQLHASPR